MPKYYANSYYLQYLIGQNSSTTKSRLFFSANTSVKIKQDVCSLVGIEERMNLGRYLGFPLMNSKLSTTDYQFLIDSLKRRLLGWKSKFLFPAGRLTLINSVLNTLPNHLMQITKLPNQVIKKMENYEKNSLGYF